MSDVVTDIFEFACQDAHWWDLLDADAEVPADVVAEVDREAFEAATEHVRDSMVALLRCCLEVFQRAAPGNDIRYRALAKKQFRPTSVVSDWYVHAPLGTRGGHALVLSVEADFEERTLRLYGYIEAPGPDLDKLEQAVPLDPPRIAREGDRFYFGDLEIRAGKQYSELAAALFDAGWGIVQAHVDLIEARRGRPSSGRTGVR